MHGYVPCSALYCLNASTEWVCSIPVCPGHLAELEERFTVTVTLRRPSQPWPSVVYYVTWPSANSVKIGVTTRLQVRLGELRTAGKMPEVVVVEPGDRTLERKRHRQFRDIRQRGSDGNRTELFLKTPELEFHMRTLAKENPDWRWRCRM